MATICLYQDTRHEKPLFWMRDVLGIGYVSRRNDGISELRINGYDRIYKIIDQLLPFIRFKAVQAKALHTAMNVLRKKSSRELTNPDLRRLARLILIIQNANYSHPMKKKEGELHKLLGLTP